MPNQFAGGNDEFTKVLLHFDGVDGSTLASDDNSAGLRASGGNAHTWTAVGNAQTNITNPGKFGPAAGLFDGAGDWITTPDHGDYTLGSGAWTVDFWFNCTVAGGSIERLCGQCDSTPTNASTSFRMYRTAGNFIEGIACVSTTAFTVTGTTQYTSAVNTGWHHAAFVRTGDILRLFIDGTQQGGDVAITGTVNDSANVLAVAQSGDMTGAAWTGTIDEFRLSVGAARWTSNFTPPTLSYDTDALTSVLLHMDGTGAAGIETAFPDHNLFVPHLTWTAVDNAQIDTAIKKFGSGAGLFDGTTDKFSTPAHPDFRLGSSDWTVDVWFNCTAAGATVKRIASQCDSQGTVNSRTFILQRSAADLITGFVSQGDSSIGINGTTQFTDTLNTGWHHVALVRAADVLKLFIDGVQEGGDLAVSGEINNSSHSLSVGQAGDRGSLGWQGSLDEFRLSVGIARWTTNFTPPVEPYF